MKEKAFTLIEVMVVMAIISILASMMAPAIWKSWENEEAATTRQRMLDIKKAMIGDKALVQNGVRTHYGFVGDNGELPFGNNSSHAGNLSHLVNKPNNGYPYWNGPYLTGFSQDWYRDAWGAPFRYTSYQDASGRYVSAELRSAGPDGVFDTGDDIVDPDLQINDYEVTPVDSVRIKVSGGTIKSLKMNINFRDPTGGSTGLGTLPDPAPCLAFSGYTTLTLERKLPVGSADISFKLYSTSVNCSSSFSTTKSTYYVNSGTSQIFVPVD
jgi:prepilin-type N-terminal cleavage/methylation domain-containing protein